LREDAIRASLARSAIQANAPDIHDGFYRVPRFLDARDGGEKRDA